MYVGTYTITMTVTTPANLIAIKSFIVKILPAIILKGFNPFNGPPVFESSLKD